MTLELLRAIGFVDRLFSTPLQTKDYEVGLQHPSGLVAVRRDVCGEAGWYIANNGDRSFFISDAEDDPHCEGYSLESVILKLAEIAAVIDKHTAATQA